MSWAPGLYMCIHTKKRRHSPNENIDTSIALDTATQNIIEAPVRETESWLDVP